MGMLMAAGAGVQMLMQQNAASNNAGALRKEGIEASGLADMSYANELRKNAVAGGAGTAAAVESGGGVGGSTKGVLDQNALNASLDALNIKYGGLLRRDTYDQQAQFDKDAATQEEFGTGLRGAASLLRVYKPNVGGYPSVS